MRRSRPRHRPQRGILPEPADDGHREGSHCLEERGLGVRSVGHHPHRLAQVPEPRHGPPHQLNGHLKLGPEHGRCFGAMPDRFFCRTYSRASRGSATTPHAGWQARSPRTTHTWPYTNAPPAGPGVGLWWIPAPCTCGPYRSVGVSSRANTSRLGVGELAEEVFVHPAQDVLAATVGVSEADGAHEVDQFPEPGLVERRASVVLRE